MRTGFVLLVLIGCGGGDFDGTYQVERTFTMWEPSPAFEFDELVTVTIDGERVQVSATSGEANFVELDGDRLSFRSTEIWPSTDAEGFANLEWDLKLDGDNLTGTIDALVWAHSIMNDFNYEFAATGERR